MKLSYKKKKIWKKPFYNAGESCSSYFIVPYFELNQSLINIIDTMEEGKKIRLGFFNIEKGIGGAKDSLELIINVPSSSLSKDNKKFSLDHKHSFLTNPGIYQSFLGLTEYCGFESVQAIKVELINEVNFTEKGAIVKQRQRQWTILSCESHSEFERSTRIIINNLDGALFLNSGIAVKLSNETKNVSVKDDKTQYYIDLITKDDIPVRLYASPLSSKLALQAVINYISSLNRKLSSDVHSKLLPLIKEPSPIGPSLILTDIDSTRLENGSDITTSWKYPTCSLQTIFATFDASKKLSNGSSPSSSYPNPKRARLDTEESDLEASAGAGAGAEIEPK